MPFSLMTRKKPESGWMAIQFSGDGVCLAHVRRVTDERPLVTFCATYKLDGTDAHALEKLGKEANLGRYQRSFLLNPGQYQMLVLEAPTVPAAELRTAVRWRIKDMLDFPAAEATVDVLNIPGDKNAPSRNRSLYAVAARNEIIRQRMETFEEAKLPLTAIDIPELAQRNIAAALEVEGRGLAMLSFDEAGGLLTFTFAGELYLSRHIEIPLSQLVQADSEQRQRHFDRITLELQRSLDHFERQFHFITLSSLVLAPLPEEVNMEAYLSSNLYVPVATMNLDDVFDFSVAPGVGPTQRQACFWALGAALRLEEGVR
jgi:MSHA biogenesis protein MshI